MTHPRQKLREAAKTLLLDAGPWQDRVFINRMRAISQRPGQRSNRDKLPALVIYTRNEQARLFNAAPRIYRCDVELVFEYVAADHDELDNELDNAAEIIERILGRNDRLSGTVNNTEYSSSQITIVDQGELQIGSVALTFTAEYDRQAPDEYIDEAQQGFNATLPDLNTVETQYSLGNAQPDPADRAKTLIEDLNP